MLEYIRSLIAEFLPQQPKPRRFQRRSLLDKREATPRSGSKQRPAAFGKRGYGRTTDRRSRH